MTRYTIVLEGERPPSLNQWLSKHWRVRDNDKRRIGELVSLTAPHDTPRPIPRPVSITVTAYFDKRLYDSDNIAVKAYIDGLRKAGILPDDTPQYVTSVTAISKTDRYRPRVEIEISEVIE